MTKKTREGYELGKQAWIEGQFGKGPVDPDMLGYPGEPEPTEPVELPELIWDDVA
jgi:hypothetical protein